MSKALFKRKHKLLIEDPDGAIYVRSMTVRELLHVEDLSGRGEEMQAMTFVVQHCCVNGDGDRLLKADEPINDVPLETVRQIFDAVGKLSQGKSIETIEKNSDAAGGSAS